MQASPPTQAQRAALDEYSLGPHRIAPIARRADGRLVQVSTATIAACVRRGWLERADDVGCTGGHRLTAAGRIARTS